MWIFVENYGFFTTSLPRPLRVGDWKSRLPSRRADMEIWSDALTWHARICQALQLLMPYRRRRKLCTLYVSKYNYMCTLIYICTYIYIYIYTHTLYRKDGVGKGRGKVTIGNDESLTGLHENAPRK